MRYYKPSRQGKNGISRKSRKRSALRRSREKRYFMYDNAAVVNFYNPYKKRSINYRKTLKLSLLFMVFAGWIALLVFLPYFRVQNIEISGTNLISQTDIKEAVNTNQQKIAGVIPGGNVLFINTDSLSQKLKTKFNLASVSVTKSLPNSLKIAITEKKMSVILISETKVSVVDNDGIELKELIKIDNTSLPVTTSTASTTPRKLPIDIKDLKKLEPKFQNLPVIYYSNENSNKLDSGRISAVLDAASEIEKGSSQGRFVMTYAELLPENEMIIYTDKIWNILCTDERSLKDQVDSVFKILKNSTPSEYVDVRMVDRVFWK